MKVLDYTGTSHLVSKTKTELAKKVDKVTGKGLSTNDYTNAEKQKVADSLTDAPSDGKQYARQDGDWEELDLDGKANIDGYYDTLSVGLADNLIDRKGNGTPQEISYRTSCGDDSIADDGNGIIQSIFGKTVVWNQLIPMNGFENATLRGVTLTNNLDGTVMLDGTATGGISAFTYQVSRTIDGHKYYFEGCPLGGSATSYYISAYGIRVDSGNGGIYTPNLGLNYINYRIDINEGTTVNNFVFKPRLIDLTAMFGSGNEPTSVDDPRIEWIKQYANEHPEYNSGELVSYTGSGIKTVGFNQFDISQIGTTNWNVNGNEITNKVTDTRAFVSFKFTAFKGDMAINTITQNVTSVGKAGCLLDFSNYDYDHIQIKHNGSTRDLVVANVIAPSHQEFYFTANVTGVNPTAVGGIVMSDINFNLSWSGYRNGEYEPYWSRTLDLPISQYFPDGMKSAGSVRDEITKDKAVKRIGKVDLGSLNYSVSSNNRFFNASLLVKPSPDNNTKANAIIVGYESQTGNGYINYDKSCYVGTNGIVYIRDVNYTDPTAFKTAMQGKYLYYELATPIETTITPPLALTYKVADFGTEESIAEGKSTPFNGIIKYSDDFTRGLVNMPKNYDTTASLDALATSLSTMLTSALDGTVTITRGAYDSTNKKYAWNCSFTPNA